MTPQLPHRYCPHQYCPGTPADQARRQREPTVSLYIRNVQLRVTHLITVAATLTGRELKDAVHTQLTLPETKTEFGGRIRMTFEYKYTHTGDLIPDDQKLDALHIIDFNTIMVELHITIDDDDAGGTIVFREGGSNTVTVLWREGISPHFTPKLVWSLVESAFEHLLP